MKRGSLFCAGPWPFIFLPLVLLFPLLAVQWHAIEKGVALNAQTKLGAAGANWATAETMNRGRNVLILGTPPNEAAIELAKAAAASAKGVNTVDISSDVKPPLASPELTTIITGDTVILEGVLPSQEDIDGLISQATKAFGVNRLDNKLSVNRNTAAPISLDGFFKQLMEKSLAQETLTASLKGSKLKLEGTIKSENARRELLLYLSQNLGLEVNSSDVFAPAPVKRDVCQELVNDLLDNSKINFASAKASIQADSFALLARIKSTALRCPDAQFEVSGHTDSTGGPSFNMSLSEQRASAVVEYLVGLGLEADRFTPIGYGANKPINENISLSGRAENRRIEFNLKN
jgi:OOP family OmpA-OmpF porin